MENDNYYIITVSEPNITSFSFAFIIVMTSIIFLNFFVFLFAIILSIGIAFISSGFLIDFNNKKLKKFTNIYGFYLGKWEDLPEIKYVSVVRVKQSRYSNQVQDGTGINQVSSNNSSYRVNLIFDEKDRKYMTLISTSREKALNEAMRIGDAFDIKVLDFSTPDRNWIR